ncbi:MULTISPECIES: hemerythrin domain-containing protein [unclassified Blastococcus]
MTVDTRPDLRPSFLEHRAMRTDAERLHALVVSADPADADRLTGLASWYARYEGAIHDHHTAEEAVIYPALVERDPTFADADGELRGEHRVLVDRLTSTGQSLQGLPAAAGGGRWERDREEAVRSVGALQDILALHLPHEEAVAFPRYRREFTAEEFTALGKAAWKVVGARAVVFAGPWVLDHATPAERAEMLAAQPLLLRLLYRLALRPRYERLSQPLHAPAPRSEV